VNVTERPGSFLVTADLPGFRKADITVALRKDRLLIAADPPERAEDGTVLRRERPRGRLRRLLTLPGEAERGGAAATYERGVLTVRVKKGRRARRVPIE
jgi:HSP20 family protein